MTPNSMKYNPAFLDDETLIRSFVVRNAELASILEVIRDNTDASNQHVLIIGPRGIGKTTLVLRSAAEVRTDPTLGSEWHPVVFGEETYQVSTPGEFWLEALFHLGQQTGEARWQQAYEELLRERDEARLCGRAIAQLMDYADTHGKRLLLVVENLNMLIGGQISSNAAWVLRKTLMNEPRLMLLGTATSRFDAIDEYNQALYELFRIIEVEPLDQEEAQALWAASTGQDAPANRIRPLQILTGGNPRLIRILSEFAAKTSFSSLMDDLTRLVDEHTEYFKHHLDSLPSQERKVFVVLADLWDPSTARKIADAARLDVNTTSALLKRLMERGAVTAPYKRGRAQYYQVAERMYNVYHLMRRRGAAASRVHAVVRFMVRFYRDEELVRTTRSLVEEARGLTADRRQELFVAYEAILQQARKPRLTKQIIEATRHAFKTMPDAPASLLKLVGLESPPPQDDATESDELDYGSLHLETVEDVEILLLLAEHLATQPNRLTEAEAAFRRALDLDPTNVLTWWQFSDFQYDKLHRPDRAFESISRALMLDPDETLLWSNQGFFLSESGRHQEALNSYDHALELSPLDPEIWTNRGVILESLERTEEALESHRRALTLDPERAVAWYNLGSVLSGVGRWVEALESYDRSLALNPENAHAWYNRGVLLSNLGREQEALESYDVALTRSPDDPDIWCNRGVVLDRLAREQEALESYNQALALNPEHAPTWSCRGIVLDELGRYQEALESYDRALALDPGEATVWYNRGVLLESLGSSDEALESHNRAAGLTPEDPDPWFGRGMALQSLRRDLEAIEAYDRALALAPDWPATWHNRAMVLSRIGQREEALESYDRALALNAQDADTWSSRGFVLASLGRDEMALKSYNRALSLEPTHPGALFSRGMLFARQRKWKQALEHATVLLQDDEFLNRALDPVIDYLISAVAAGEEDEVLRIINASHRSEAFEPLVVAIQRLAGSQVDVAREVMEVANDVMKRIEERRAALRGA